MRTLTTRSQRSGGLELLFGNQKSHEVDVAAPSDNEPVRSCFALCAVLLLLLLLLCCCICCPSCHPAPACPHRTLHTAPTPQLTVRQLLPWARDNLLQDRPELFMKGDSV